MTSLATGSAMPSTETVPALSWQTKQEVAELLAREAHLIDERRFEEWLDLFTEDCEYYMPLREYLQGDVPAAGHPVIKDTKEVLRIRVAKEATGYSHVDLPPSMTCHVVTNIVVDPLPGSDDVEARSTFIVRQARKLRDEAWWAGRRKDRLRNVEGEWRIVRREVTLDATIFPRGVSVLF